MSKTKLKTASKKINVCLIALAYLFTCCLLTGCGTKGPLYIPEQRYPQGAENNIIPHATKLDALQSNIHAPSRAS
jgi:predicted small lipoprotein YifL